ncbi:hypothetical protein [Enterococcus innesii]|uniref:hypothetical protein n=1 Tax=Enterococcus innesii TaxID=2839759 RepID=UPI003BDBC384
MYLDEFVVEAGVIVSALESLNEKVRDVKFVNLNDANQVIAQIECLTVYSKIHSKKLEDISIGEVAK